MYPQPVGQGSVSYPVIDVAGSGPAYGQGSYRSGAPSYWTGDGSGGGVEDPNYSLSAYGDAAHHAPVPNVQFGECGDGSIPRFRVLHEPPNASPEEVVLQIGMDGVKLISKSGTTLRIYPLETITRWAIRDKSVFVFWSKNQADRDPSAVTIRSDERTSGAILDVITAACVQLSEMIEEDNATAAPREEPRAEDLAAAARTAGPIEEKETREHWVPDSAVSSCQGCTSSFTAFRRRHHCRSCGGLFCDRCTQGRISLLGSQPSEKVRVCDRCAAEAIMREEAEKEPYRPPPPPEPAARSSEQPRSHQDLARRLEQQMGASQQQHRPPREVVCDAYASQAYGAGGQGGGGYSHHGGGGGGVPPLVDVGAAYGVGVGGGSGGGGVPSGPPHLWSQSPPSAPPPMHMSAPSAPGVGYGAPTPAQRQQEVMCPTCSTRLQVMVGHQDVPVECGVCHAAFLVAGSG